MTVLEASGSTKAVLCWHACKALHRYACTVCNVASLNVLTGSIHVSESLEACAIRGNTSLQHLLARGSDDEVK